MQLPGMSMSYPRQETLPSGPKQGVLQIGRLLQAPDAAP